MVVIWLSIGRVFRKPTTRSEIWISDPDACGKRIHVEVLVLMSQPSCAASHRTPRSDV